MDLSHEIATQDHGPAEVGADHAEVRMHAE